MAKKTVAAKKRNVKVDAMGQLTFIALSTISLCLLQTVRVRLFLGLLPVRWASAVLEEHSLRSSDGCSGLR